MSGAPHNGYRACRHLTAGPRIIARRLVPVLLTVAAGTAAAQDSRLAAAMDAYIRPYVTTGNFSGTALVMQGGHTVFERSYGFADREQQIRNTSATAFHVASVSMQFTAGAVLRLADRGELRLNDRVGSLLAQMPGGDRITIGDLLIEQSGLPDINALPGYADILQQHQTPGSLVARIAGRPLLFEPGSKYVHEEHSAYNALALLIEQRTGKPFGRAMQDVVFGPLTLRHTFIDDDSSKTDALVARGYQPVGVNGVSPAQVIHWSGKAGNASVATTAEDEARWITAVFGGRAFSPASRSLVTDTVPRIGYGWFRGTNARFGGIAYTMSGRAPGFASYVLYLPRAALTVVVLSNMYSSATSAMGSDLASIVLGLPYSAFHPIAAASADLRGINRQFQFGPDFYQKNAVLTITPSDTGVTLDWPSGDRSALIPLGRDTYVDRSYWQDVHIDRDTGGQPIALRYGEFRGEVIGRPRAGDRR